MNSIEQVTNEDTLKKEQPNEDDIDCKQSVTTDAKTCISPFPFTLTNATTQCASLSSKNEPSEISDSDSIPEKDILIPFRQSKFEKFKIHRDRNSNLRQSLPDRTRKELHLV